MGEGRAGQGRAGQGRAGGRDHGPGPGAGTVTLRTPALYPRPKVLHCAALHCTALHCTALHCLASYAAPIGYGWAGLGPAARLLCTMPCHLPHSVPCHRAALYHTMPSATPCHAVPYQYHLLYTIACPYVAHDVGSCELQGPARPFRGSLRENPRRAFVNLAGRRR
jgi:hypothetical protein